MNTVLSLAGPFDDALLDMLFVDNTEPTQEEIAEAIRDAEVYGHAAERLAERCGVERKWHADQQEMFGPLVRLLSLAGWTLAGSGHFSVAFHKGGLGLKIGLKPEYDAALTYLDWCKDNEALPGVPKLHALGRFDRCYVVLMDRYEALAGEQDDASPMYDPHIKAEFDALKHAIRKGVPGSFATSTTGAIIHHTFKDVGRFDLHSGNVMLARDGSLVVTDPIGRTDQNNNSYTGYYSYTYSVAA